MKVRKVNGVYEYSDLVGQVFYKNGIECTFMKFDKIIGSLSIQIDSRGNKTYMNEEIISLAFGDDAFREKLLSYGVTIEEDIVVALFMGEVVSEAHKLASIGFDYIETVGENVYAKSSTDEFSVLNVTKIFSKSLSQVPDSISRESNRIPLLDFYSTLLK
ncbi:MAG: hypothetical protein ACRC6B_02365 [Fusobacteriaceae bacterium]